MMKVENGPKGPVLWHENPKQCLSIGFFSPSRWLIFAVNKQNMNQNSAVEVEKII